jgi:hypothetical protein
MLIKAAQRAEALGYDSHWVLERLLDPLDPRTPYATTADGKIPRAFQRVFEPRYRALRGVLVAVA